MAALKLTLQRLGLDVSGLPTTSANVSDADTVPAKSGAAASKTQGAMDGNLSHRFLVALYQALVFHHAIDAPAEQPVNTEPADAVTAAYVDLGSSIEQLAKTVRSTFPDRASVDESWDWKLDDTDTSSPTGHATPAVSGTLSGAVNSLKDALQPYVPPVGKAGGVSLADVLDGLGRETRGVKWNPLGLVVDVKI